VEEEIASFKTSIENLNTPYLIEFELKPHQECTKEPLTILVST
jgi:hypothetical protein